MKPYPTAEEVAALFGKWGLRPDPTCFIGTYAPCGCAAGVILVNILDGIENVRQRRRSRPDLDFLELLRDETGWPQRFIDGLSEGFTLYGSAIRRGSDDYDLGYNLGHTVRQQLIRRLPS
jgi:hypothetical protein